MGIENFNIQPPEEKEPSKEASGALHKFLLGALLATGLSSGDAEARQNTDKVAGSHHETLATKDGVKASFGYSKDGEVVNMTMNGGGDWGKTKSTLSPSYQSNIRVSGAGLSFDKHIIETRATTVSMYRGLLEELEKEGRGASQEAVFLAKEIKSIIEQTEKKYGDVFK